MKTGAFGNSLPVINYVLCRDMRMAKGNGGGATAKLLSSRIECTECAPDRRTEVSDHQPPPLKKGLVDTMRETI